MRLMPARAALSALAALGAFPAMPAAADAVSYSGHIGSLPVIVELTTSGGITPQVGRYAYRSKGVDIPLHLSVHAGGLRIMEESACTEALCRTAGGDLVTEAPIGAEWTLPGAVGDKRLRGTWRALPNGRTLQIDLQLRARRAEGDGSRDPFEALTGSAPDPAADDTADPVVSTAERPYDFLRMEIAFDRGPELPFGDGVIRMDTDPRNGLDYPVIVSLAGADPAPLNAYLAQQRLQAEAPAFACAATAYLGFGWSGSPSDGSDGFDGNWSVRPEHLTSRLMGFAESGSYFCAGAYPDNFTRDHLVDAVTGRPIDADRLLAGWNGDAAGPDLSAYVNARRDRSDSQREADCGLDDLVRTHLGVYFRQHSLVFTLKDLPHAIFACTDDLLEIPLSQARPLLTDAGAAYFAAFD